MYGDSTRMRDRLAREKAGVGHWNMADYLIVELSIVLDLDIY